MFGVVLTTTLTKVQLVCVHADVLFSVCSPSGQWVQAVLGVFWQPSTLLGW